MTAELQHEQAVVRLQSITQPTAKTVWFLSRSAHCSAYILPFDRKLSSAVQLPPSRWSGSAPARRSSLMTSGPWSLAASIAAQKSTVSSSQIDVSAVRKEYPKPVVIYVSGVQYLVHRRPDGSGLRCQPKRRDDASLIRATG